MRELDLHGNEQSESQPVHSQVPRGVRMRARTEKGRVGWGRDVLVALGTVLALSAALALSQNPATANGAGNAEASFDWSTRAGGAGFDEGTSVSVLPDGSAIVTGQFTGTATFGATELVSVDGSGDIFVAKIGSDGVWLWATQAGGSGFNAGLSVSVLADGSAIATGRFVGTVTFGATDLVSAGSNDVFVARIGADGVWLWATQAGRIGGNAEGYGVSVSLDGSAIVTGVFRNTVTFGAMDLVSAAGSDDVFVARIGADGVWLWAARAGSAGRDEGLSVAVSADGSAMVTGWFEGTATFGAAELVSAGSRDAFVARIDADGVWLWATRAGGVGLDDGYGVSVLADGSAIVTGRFVGTATFGATELVSAGDSDVFVARVDADGVWLWANRAGGTGFDSGLGVSVLADGSAVVTGRFELTATFDAIELESAGTSDGFVARIGADGVWLWAIRAGGIGFDAGSAVSVLSDGSAIVAGYFTNTATFGTTVHVSAGTFDVFVARVLPPILLNLPVEPVLRLAVGCGGESLQVGSLVTCTVTGGDPGIDILWRAAYNPVFAEAGVTLGTDGTGTFSFVVPAAALGQEVTVELVEWLPPLSLGVVGGPVPGSVPAGEGPVPVWPIVLVALAGVVLMRRGMLVKG